MMYRISEKRLNRERGQSLTEFALIVPLVLVIFMGIFDFGWIMHKQMTMDNAARAAARKGAVGVQTPALIARIKETLYFPVTDEQIKITVLDREHNDIGDNTDRTPDYYIRIDIQLKDVQLITPLGNLVNSMGGAINLSSFAEFLIE